MSEIEKEIEKLIYLQKMVTLQKMKIAQLQIKKLKDGN
jgi:hypothetical protein